MNIKHYQSKPKSLLKSKFKLPEINNNGLESDKKANTTIEKYPCDPHRAVARRIQNLKVNCPGGGPLTTWEISKYRQPKFEIILREMLLKGYHRSFSTLFNINLERERKRQVEGPDSTRWNLQSIRDHPKLDQIKEYLCMIEDALRLDDYPTLLIATGFLITTFGEFEEDAWIVQQFVDTELECSSKVSLDHGYMKALANLTAGINAEKNYNYILAAEHLSRVFSMAYAQNWKDANGVPIMKVCSEHLSQVYLHLACEVSHTKPPQMLTYLKQAHEISREADLKTVEAMCCLELGIVFEKLNNLDMAIAYYRALFEVTHNINDQYRLGLASEAISRCYEKQNNRLEAIRYMEKFVEINEKACDWNEYARSCRVLGEMYNRFEDYANANLAFSNSYQITYCLRVPHEFNETKILKGVAEGNNINKYVTNHIVTNTREPVTRLMHFRIHDEKASPEIFAEQITQKNIVSFSNRARKNMSD